MTILPPKFDTLRLIGRAPRLADCDAIYAGYATDPKVARFMIWKTYTDKAELSRWLTGVIAKFGGCRNEYVLALKDREDEAVGMISIRTEGHMASVGYVLRRDLWGQGLMQEALGWLVDWALDQREIYRVWAVCDVENSASARVMGKVGMEREGMLRRWVVHLNCSSEPRDAWSYAKTK